MTALRFAAALVVALASVDTLASACSPQPLTAPLRKGDGAAPSLVFELVDTASALDPSPFNDH